MRCKNIEILLSDLVEGTLDKSMQKKVEEHLAGCEACRNKLGKLKDYSLVLSRVEKQEVPSDLREKIWDSIEEKGAVGTTEKTFRIAPAGKLAIAALAASIVLLIIIQPFGTNILTMDTSFSFVTEKGGKGPSVERVYKKGSDPRVDEIIQLADSTGSTDTRAGINKASGLIDYIMLKMPAGRYQEFREIYNSKPGADALGPLPGDYRKKNVRVQVYIPGRSFFTGDFNGDRHVDFGTFFNRGKYAGEIFISINDLKGNFGAHSQVSTESEKLILKPGDRIISGDLNADKLDDLIIIYGESTAGDPARCYLNKGDNIFAYEKDITLEIEGDEPGRWRSYLSGKCNNDDLDDIVLVNYRGIDRGIFNIFINKADSGFSLSSRVGEDFEGMDGDERFTPLLMDINGDKLDDPCIYWQSGEKDAFWYFALNMGDGTYGKPFYAGFGKGYRAFMGSYIPLSGDIDGDGYDELLVKLGTSDEISQWYLMHNRRDSTFALGRPLLFMGNPDIVIR